MNIVRKEIYDMILFKGHSGKDVTLQSYEGTFPIEENSVSINEKDYQLTVIKVKETLGDKSFLVAHDEPLERATFVQALKDFNPAPLPIKV